MTRAVLQTLTRVVIPRGHRVDDGLSEAVESEEAVKPAVAIPAHAQSAEHPTAQASEGI